MLPGPVFAAELVTSVRRVRYFLLRGLYGIVLLMLVWINFSNVGHWGYTPIQKAAQLASGMMAGFAWLQLTAILLVAPAMAAGAIATERERRTIEYLFATDLSNAELVLGKTAARLLHVMYLVLCGLPVLALVSLLGGISADLLLAVFLIAVSTMLMVVGLSVCLSVWSPRARDAVTRVYIVLAALLLLPMIVYAWTNTISRSWSGAAQDLFAGAINVLLAINPLWVQGRIWTAGGPAGANLGWHEVLTCVGGQTALAIVCLALATVVVRRVHLSASGRSEKVRGRTRFRWRPTLGDRPMLWKEMFSGHANVRLGMAGRIAATLLVVAIVAVVCYGFAIALDAKSTNRFGSALDQYYETAGWLSVLVGCGGLLLVGARAAGAITGEVERDCWVALLSTPLSAKEIVVAKVVGSLYAARWVVALMLGILGLGVLLDPGYAIVVPVQLLVWGCTALFAAALGVRYSLACSTTLRAMGATLATLIFVGGGYLFCCAPIFIRGPEAIVFSACVPMLMVIPSLSYMTSHGEPELMLAFIIGMVGYGFGSLALIAASISALRWPTNVPWIPGAPMPRLQAKSTVAAALPATDLVIAELVDESPPSPTA